MEPAEFLNLDLALWSHTDLTPLAQYLDKHASLLYNGEHSGMFHITAEPLIGGHSNIDPASARTSCSRRYLRFQTTWQRCSGAVSVESSTMVLRVDLTRQLTVSICQ